MKQILVLTVLFSLGLSAQSFTRRPIAEPAMNVVSVGDSLVRPANITTYTAGDAVNDSNTTVKLMVFKNVARDVGGAGYIVGAKIFVDTANTANASFRLYIYADSVTPTADNAAFVLKYVNRYKNLGYIDLALSTEGTTSTSAIGQAAGYLLEFHCRNTSRNLYGILVCEGAYVPGRLSNIFVSIKAVRQ